MSTKNIHQRLAEAMGEVSYIQKDKKQGMQYSIVSHDAVTAKVRPALLSAGIVYYPVNMEHGQNGNRTEVSLSVRFVNVDKPDDFIDVPAIGYGIDQQDKGPGKAISYAVKYALLKALGLETGDDPDMEQNVQHETRDPALWKSDKEKKKYLNGLMDGAVSEDALAVRELWDEMSNEQQMDVWKSLKEFSTQRAKIKTLLAETADKEDAA